MFCQQARLPLAGVAATIATLVITSCTTGSSSQTIAPTPSGRTSSSPVAASPSATISARRPTSDNGRPQFAVGTVVRDFTDSRRARTLRTTIYFPARGAPLQSGSRPANGAFSLVLMAHGYRLPVAGYDSMLRRVASAGYVVAAPAFPHTSPHSDGNRSDIVNQPADLSFVLDAVVRLAEGSSGIIPPVSNPTRVAGLGHSDGGLTVSAWAYNAIFRDRRLACAVVLTGGIGLFPGTYFPAGPQPPLLAIHATGDQTNPYSASVNLFDAIPSGTPRYLLTIEGGSHLGPYMFDTALPEIGQVIVDFLDSCIGGDRNAVRQLSTDGSHPGVTSLRTG